MLSEVARCLRAGALLTVFEPNWESFRVRSERVVIRSLSWIANVRRPEIGAALWTLVEAAGFEVLDRVEEIVGLAAPRRARPCHRSRGFGSARGRGTADRSRRSACMARRAEGPRRSRTLLRDDAQGHGRRSAAVVAGMPRPTGSSARGSPEGAGPRSVHSPRVRIAIGGDHAGYPLKQHLVGVLTEWAHAVDDLGTDSTEPVDYPPICAAVARAVVRRRGRRRHRARRQRPGRADLGQQGARRPRRALQRPLHRTTWRASTTTRTCSRSARASSRRSSPRRSRGSSSTRSSRAAATSAGSTRSARSRQEETIA